jgi:phosphatidylethanolamine/phosphatidyl-N-methylethanolamine N-methyltransferase
MGKNLPTHSANRLYDKMAGLYDHFAHGIVHRRQKAAIERMNIQPGSKVLEIGVGTGLSLTLWPKHCTVYGLDLSGGMLSQARKRMLDAGLNNIRLVRANALQPPFAEGSFDYIFLSHVISVVEHPGELVRVIRRLGKPGCRIVIVNHFKSSNPLVGLIERWVNPICHKLGWRSDLTLKEVVEEGGLQIDFQFKLQVFDLWRIVFATNADADTREVLRVTAPPPPLPSPAVQPGSAPSDSADASPALGSTPLPA